MDTRAYNRCVDAHSDRLFRFIVKSEGDAERAKDIVQDAFVKLWESHAGLEEAKAKSWLFTTGYRIMIDGIRRSKKMTRMESHIEEPSHSDQYSDLQEILHEALDRLPAIQKQVILLRDYEGYDYIEIGSICNLSESQVKVYIFRGRKKLKEYLVDLKHLI